MDNIDTSSQHTNKQEGPFRLSCLFNCEEIDELSSDVLNVAYWKYKDKEKMVEPKISL